MAITSFADNSRHSSAWAADCYRAHGHAVLGTLTLSEIVARGWVRVLWACWSTDTIYDPLRHSGEQRLALTS